MVSCSGIILPQATYGTRSIAGDLLQAWGSGDAQALERLTPLVYGELRRIARRYMQREYRGHTLQTTALVNEAYIRLVDGAGVRWQDRAHFFAISSQMMRRILVDAARARGSAKRGGPAARVSLDEGMIVAKGRDRQLIALDDALERLSQFDVRKAGHRAAVLRRIECGGDRGSLADIAAERHAGLEACQGLAVTRHGGGEP